MDNTRDIVITKDTLDINKCYQHVQDIKAGGNALFVGTVRDQTKGNQVLKLEFEAFRPMAIKEMDKIAQLMEDRWNAIKVSIHHRVGVLELGEIAVIIAVSTPHRKAAFDACQFAIDTLKETVPIWKKEFFEGGEIWVAAHP